MLQLFRCFLFLFALGMIHGQTNLNKDAEMENMDSRLSMLPYYSYTKGFGMVTPDSAYLMYIRFRMQNRLAAFMDDEGNQKLEARIRRLRLRFDGWIHSPQWIYIIQLSFSPGDVSGFIPGEKSVPNIIRDAIVYYKASKNLSIGFGQTKLPGNRERVVSSSALQLGDRSYTNAIYTTDRDFGVQFRTSWDLGETAKLRWNSAISTGEGRNWVSSNDFGLMYTSRIEILPLGNFTNNGDYFQGDLMRETTGKLMLGFGAYFNEKARREQGTKGDLLLEQSNMYGTFVDFVFKRKGWATEGGFISRESQNFLAQDSLQTSFTEDGYSFYLQSSYLFKSNIELVGRYTHQAPRAGLRYYLSEINEYVLGINYYLRGHSLKLQLDAAYLNAYRYDVNKLKNELMFRLQIELGI